MKSLFKLKELIVKKIDLGRVMQDYKVDFALNPDILDEVQFKCPFHGKDNKPSARYYRSTQLAYCWVCQKKWDVVDFVMDKEILGFSRTIRHIINKYNIDTSSISDDPEFKIIEPQKIAEVDILMISIKNKIKSLRGEIDFNKYNLLCTSFYIIMFNLYQEIDVLEGVKKFNSKIEEIGLKWKL